VVDKPSRRKFSVEYKLHILELADKCAEPGSLGRLLRQEGVYSSSLSKWRRQRAQGILRGLSSSKRGPKPAEPNPLTSEVQRLQKENRRLSKKLQKAELLIEVQKKNFSTAGSGNTRREQLMQAVETLAPTVGKKAVCAALGVSRATLYRSRGSAGMERPSKPSSRALSPEEKQQVLDILHSERFVDKAPQEIYAVLLDEGRYLCSIRTMYRIMKENGEVRERRDQLAHPVYQKPELLATRPNEVWSWDITKLLGPVKWSYYYLYVILDIFSRYVVGWLLADRESAVLAQKLIEETCRKQNILPGQLTIHADRGSSMKSKPVAFLLADLGVTKTHSRPHTSNDNPFSESQFNTLKYRPDFPDRFFCVEEARSHCRSFFHWYNQAHPERFVRGVPSPAPLAEAVWINPPSNKKPSEQDAP
jgi:putative transposase